MYAKPQKPMCVDYYGNEIHLGDYVVAVCDTGISGYVSNFHEFEYGTFIEISTLGGRLIRKYAVPTAYKIHNNNE